MTPITQPIQPQTWLFAMPLWLWLTPLLVGFGVALWFTWRRVAKRRLARFMAPRHFAVAIPAVNWRQRGGQFVVTVLALVLLAIALARPLRGPLPGRAEARGVDFVVALDVSKSMVVEDVLPNRLAAIRKALGEFVGELRGDRMGLILFAGDAIVQAPVTFDYVALNHVLQQATPKSISLGGTNIPRAVEMAQHLLKNAEPRSKILLIVTDGENLEGDPLNAVRTARATDGLTVFTVGVGTVAGGKVPAADYSTYAVDKDGKLLGKDGKAWSKNYVKNEYGLPAISRLDNRMLRLIAEAGGGRYFEFRPELKTFQTLHAQHMLPMAEKSQTLNVRDYAEWYQLPLGLAMLMVVGVPLISALRTRPVAAGGAGVEVVMPETLSKPTGPRGFIRARNAVSGKISTTTASVCIAMMVFATTASEQSRTATAMVPATSSTAPSEPPTVRAEALLAGKKSDDAVALMRTEVERSPADPYLFYNYAMTLYRAGRQEEAIAAFESLRQSTDIAALQDKAAFQMGNVQVRLGERLWKNQHLAGAILSLERAIIHYDDAAARDGADKTLRNNREVAAKLLESILMKAGEKYTAAADAAKENLSEEERVLRNAQQAFERAAEVNAKNAEAPKKAEEVRERLAQNLAKQASKITEQADAKREEAMKKPEDPKKAEEARKKAEQALGQYEQAVAKLDDALGLKPEDKPLTQQKQDVQNKMSDLLTAVAEKQIDKATEKPKIDDSALNSVASAKEKLDQAVALNPENQKAEDLAKKAADILEKGHVERGEANLAAAEKNQKKPQEAVNNLNAAAEHFQKALAVAPESKPAQEGLAKANEKLPDALAAAGDAEAAKAADAMAGKQPSAKGQPAPSPQQNLQKAVGFLEKANQNYGMALQMKPEDGGLQQRAEAVGQQLAAARDQLDEQLRAAMAGQPTPPGSEAAMADSDQPPQPSDAETGEQNSKRKLLSMSDLGGKAKPNTGDNFWQKGDRDW